MSQYITYHFRIKDSNKALRKELFRLSSAVNTVWNFCKETQITALNRHDRWPTNFDLQKLTKGSSELLDINAQTIQYVCEQYTEKRKAHKKPLLRWRSYKKNTVWIPFKYLGIKVDRENGTAKYYGTEFNFWNHRSIIGEIRTGSICSDARGRFYLNLTCKLPDQISHPKPGLPAIGVDLGLKEVAVTSEGKRYGSARYFKKYENNLGKAQRAGKKKQVRNIHAKIANSRKDNNHKIALDIVRSASSIIVGNVSAKQLIETKPKMAKSITDVSWSQLESFMNYKALASGIPCTKVNEAYSTMTCSDCHTIPTSSPKGTPGLKVREWTCNNCGCIHDRDINAAKNILRFGHESQTLQGAIVKNGALVIAGEVSPRNERLLTVN